MVKIRIADHVRLHADKMTKVALASTPRAQLDLYCLAPGQAQRPHTHAEQDKFYLVIEGQGRIQIGAAEETAGPGEVVLAPAGTAHGVLNDGSAPLVLLVVVAPPPAHA